MTVDVDVALVLLEHGSQQLVAITEVVLQSARVALARGSGDLPQGHAVDAALREQSLGRTDEGTPRVGLAARVVAAGGGAHHGVTPPPCDGVPAGRVARSMRAARRQWPCRPGLHTPGRAFPPG